MSSWVARVWGRSPVCPRASPLYLRDDLDRGRRLRQFRSHVVSLSGKRRFFLRASSQIKDRTFSFRKLESFPSLASNVSTIEESALVYCTGLSSFPNIPHSVSNIGREAFTNLNLVLLETTFTSKDGDESGATVVAGSIIGTEVCVTCVYPPTASPLAAPTTNKPSRVPTAQPSVPTVTPTFAPTTMPQH